MEQLKKTAHKLTEQYCQRWCWCSEVLPTLAKVFLPPLGTVSFVTPAPELMREGFSPTLAKNNLNNLLTPYF
jgi:hypothetical protein